MNKIALNRLANLFAVTCLMLPIFSLMHNLAADEPDPQIEKLLQGSWVVEQIGDHTLTKPNRPTLIVNPKNEVYGNTVINRYAGQLADKNSALIFSSIRSTLRAGVNELMEIENQWKAVLEKASKAKREKNQLQFFNGDQLLATLKGVNMTGEWKLTRLGENLLEDPQHELTLTITEDGKVNGNTGVNLLMGQLSSEKEKLFGPLGTTRRAGDPAMMQMENSYLEALRKSNRFEVDGPTLSLLENDKRLLQFQTTEKNEE